MGDAEAAKVDCSRVLERVPNNAKALFRRAQAELELKVVPPFEGGLSVPWLRDNPAVTPVKGDQWQDCKRRSCPCMQGGMVNGGCLQYTCARRVEL